MLRMQLGGMLALGHMPRLAQARTSRISSCCEPRRPPARRCAASGHACAREPGLPEVSSPAATPGGPQARLALAGAGYVGRRRADRHRRRRRARAISQPGRAQRQRSSAAHARGRSRSGWPSPGPPPTTKRRTGSLDGGVKAPRRRSQRLRGGSGSDRRGRGSHAPQLERARRNRKRRRPGAARGRPRGSSAAPPALGRAADRAARSAGRSRRQRQAGETAPPPQRSQRADRARSGAAKLDPPETAPPRPAVARLRPRGGGTDAAHRQRNAQSATVGDRVRPWAATAARPSLDHAARHRRPARSTPPETSTAGQTREAEPTRARPRRAPRPRPPSRRAAPRPEAASPAVGPTC